MRDGKIGKMPKIAVGRYSAKGGTKSAPPVGAEWLGWLEPEDKSWILWVKRDGTPVFYGQREADGTVVEPEMSAMVGGRFVSAWAMGQDVFVTFADGKQRVDGTIAGVTFTNYGKVLYDIEVPVVFNGRQEGTTVLERVDSVFVCRDPGGGSAPVKAVDKVLAGSGNSANVSVKGMESGARAVRLREEGWDIIPGTFEAWRRVGELDVGIREQVDQNIPGKPWVAHEHYETLSGATGSRRVAFGVDEKDARRRGEYNAIMYPYPLMVSPDDEANADYLGL